MSRDWTIALTASVACHLAGAVALWATWPEPPRLPSAVTTDGVVEIALIALPAAPSAPPAAEAAPSSIPQVPTPVIPAAPPPVMEPVPPEVTPTLPEPQLVTAPLEAAEPPVPVALSAESGGPSTVAGADAVAVSPSGTSANGVEMDGTVSSGSSGTGQSARPRYRQNVAPEYPALARQRRQEGLVLLAVRVSAGGRAGEVAVRQSSGFPLLDAAAIKAVERWEFEPARNAGLAVESFAEVPVRFQLGN